MQINPEDLIGTCRRFGAYGPAYEILEEGLSFDEGVKRMKIRVIETGESLDYPLSEILDDPRER
jgi:Family of unknown function (DUF5397)